MATQHHPKSPEALRREIDHLSSLDVASLRAVWQTTFKRKEKGIPPGILLRMLAWRVQENTLGGYDKATEKALDQYAGPARSREGACRHLGAGTVLVREYQGHRYTVTVVPDGFVWRDQTYTNLSKIACAITGVKWNGPRFFGLRQLKQEKMPNAGAGG